MWECPTCHARQEDSIDACWKCGTSRSGVEVPTFRHAEEVDPASLERPWQPHDPLPGPALRRSGKLNGFDKFCAALAFCLGAVFVLLGVLGLFAGASFHFTLPPVVGVLPAIVGWGIVRSVMVAWK